MANDIDLLIDNILVFMNNEIEERGNTINAVWFNFSEDAEDASKFMTTMDSISYPEILKAANICLSRRYIKRMCSGDPLENLMITELGQARAISYQQRDEKAVTDNAPQVYINNLTNHNGNIAVGNGNTQTANITIQELIDKIESSDASDTEKEEAKNLLGKFIEHPLVNTALGAGAAALIAMLGA